MILHAITNLRASSGGPTTAVVELAREQAMGAEPVRLILDEAPLDVAAHSGEETTIAARWSGRDVKVHLAAGAGSGRCLNRRQIVACLADLRPRIVHLHGVWDPIVRRTASACASLGIPWVVSSHGMLHPSVLAKGRLKKNAYLAFFRGTLCGARTLLTLNSEEATAVHRRFGVPVVVSPTGIDPCAYRQNSDGSFARSVSGLRTEPFVLFLGRLDPIKGVDLLIESFACAVGTGATAHLVVAGPDFGAETALRAQVDRLGLSGRVHFVGSLSGDRKLAALAECSLYAHRPRYEGFGIAVVEAMASGRPVITTAECRIDGAAEAGAIFRCPDRTEPFGLAMATLLNDTAASRRLAAAGRAWVEEHLSWPAVLGVIEQAYRR